MNLLERRSIRKYKKQEISQELLDYILKCGIRSSNCGTMQLYSIIVTREEEGKKRLAPLHFNQPMVMDCSVVLTVCLDINRFHHWCRINNAEESLRNFLFHNIASIDATICTQTMATAAEEKGLGICYLGTVNYNAKGIAEVLNLPKGVIPVTTLTIGYPDEMPELTERLPMEALVHYEKYNDYSDEDIKRLYSDIEANPKNQAFVKENNLENLAQVFSQVRYNKKDAEYFSQMYKEYMKETFCEI